jgi:Uma2 family endonuclease
VSEAIAFISFDSFVGEEQNSERRHELVGGRVYAMAGGSERHDLAAGLLYEFFAPGARSAGCRPFTSNRLLRTRGGNADYPNVMVVCGPAAHRLYEADPAVLIEVLSPSTADQDRREKAVAYAESLVLLALVDPTIRRIEVARPVAGTIRAWTLYGSTSSPHPMETPMSTPFTTRSTRPRPRPSEARALGADESRLP